MGVINDDDDSTIVHPYGKQPSTVLLVGEAPGREEFYRRRPFVGKTGIEQQRLLARHDVNVHGWRLANVIPQYIEGNPDPTPQLIDKWTPYLEREVRETSPRLIVAVGRYAMRWYLGEKAELDSCHGIAHFAGAFDSTRLHRGGPAGAVVIPVHHPAAGFYNADLRALIAWDYEQVAKAYKVIQRGGEVPALLDLWKGQEGYHDVSGKEFAAGVRVAGSNRDRVIALDTEGTPDAPWSIQMAFKPGVAACLRVSRLDFAVGIAALQKAVNDGVTIITHDAHTPRGCLYDTQMCRAMGLELRYARQWNTMYAAYLLRLEPKGLKALAYRHAAMEMDSYSAVVEGAARDTQVNYLCEVLCHKWPKPAARVRASNDGTAKIYTPQGADKAAERILVDFYGKPDVDLYARWSAVDDEVRGMVEAKLGRMPWSDLDNVPRDIATRYACRDADATLRVYTALKARLKERDLVTLMDRGMEVLPILEEMQATGIPASRNMFESLVEDLQTGMERLQSRISHRYYGGKPFNPKSPKQVATILRRRGLEPAKRTPTGVMSTGKQSIEHLRYLDPAVADIVEWREKAHIKSMFGDVMLDLMDPAVDIQPVHTRINPLGTTTRRLATNDPNLLAFPKHEKPGGNDYGKQIRSCFIAPPGQVFLECDLSQIELRMFAHESRDEVMCKIFTDGKIDLHSNTAVELFNLPIDKLHDKDYWKSEPGKTQRSFAKRINFGIPYGVSGMGMEAQLRMMGITAFDSRACQQKINGWHKVYQGGSRYIAAVENETARTGLVRDCWGMLRYLPGVWSEEPQIVAEAKRQAVNHRIQGGAQGLIQNAMLWLRPYIRELQESGLEVYWCLQVHDALMFRLDEELVDVVEPLVNEALTKHNGMKLIVPVLADSKTARTWGEL